jgi:hypothetical protein
VLLIYIFFVQDASFTKVLDALAALLDRKKEFEANAEDIDFDADSDDGNDPMQGPRLLAQLEDAQTSSLALRNVVNIRDATSAEQKAAMPLCNAVQAACALGLQLAPAIHLMVTERALIEASNKPEMYKHLVDMDDTAEPLGLGRLMASGCVPEDTIRDCHSEHVIKFVRQRAQVGSCTRKQLEEAVGHMCEICKDGPATAEVSAMQTMLTELNKWANDEDVSFDAASSAKLVVTKTGAKMAKPFMICPVLTNLLVDVAAMVKNSANDALHTDRIETLVIEVNSVTGGQVAPDRKVAMIRAAIADIWASGSKTIKAAKAADIAVVNAFLLDQVNLRMDDCGNRFTAAFGEFFERLKTIPKDLTIKTAAPHVNRLREILEKVLHAIMPDMESVGSKEDIANFSKVAILDVGALIQRCVFFPIYD